MSRVREQTKAPLVLKGQGGKSITQTPRELEAIKKGLLSRSRCPGARQLQDPKQEGNREKNTPTCPSPPSEVASHGLKPQKPAGKGGLAHRG